jgi:hypothetical protein
MVLCWDATGRPVVELGGDDALKACVREYLWPPRDASLIRAIEFVGLLPGRLDDVLFLRRMRTGLLLLAVLPADAQPFELARLHFGHAALAVERAVE